MKGNIVRLSAVVALVAILGLTSALAVSPAAAKTTRTPFDNYNVGCEILEQTMWVSEGGIVHIRERELRSVVVTESPYHSGPGKIVANANITDPVNGYGNFWGTLEIYPDAHPEGYWAGSFAVQVNKGMAGGIARLQGYGTLDGLSSKSELTPLTPDQLADYYEACDCANVQGPCPVSGAHAVGFTMNPGGK